MSVHAVMMTVVLSAACLAAGADIQPVALPEPAGLELCLWTPAKPAPAVRMYVRSGQIPWKYNRPLGDQPLVLGEIRLSGVEKTAFASAPAGEDFRSCRFGGLNAEGTVLAATATASRLSPAVLVDLERAASVDLFAGDKSVRWAWGLPSGSNKDAIDGFVQAYPYPSPAKLAQPGAPRQFAAGDGTRVRSGTLDAEPVRLDGAERGWLLLWFGSESWFLQGHDAPNAPGDLPILLVLSHPASVSIVAGGDGDAVRLDFGERGAKLAIMPLLGYSRPPAARTVSWSQALPKDIRRRCDFWAARLAEFPRSVHQKVRYDEQAHAAVFRQTVEFVTVRPGGVRFAPLPPMLELARRTGLPVRVSPEPVPTDLPTYCGPYAGVEKAAQYEYRIAGMDRYALEYRTRGPRPGEPPSSVEQARLELLDEVDRMLAAGHLAPVNIPWKTAWNWGAFHYSSVRHVYFAPGQVLATLASAQPWLDGPRRQKVLEYLKAERRAYPPESLAHLPSEQGARREPYRLTEKFTKTETNKLRDQNFHIKTRTVPAEALYDLAAYYRLAGREAMRQEKFELSAACQRTIDPWLAREDWATLGWYAWPLEQRDPQYYASYGWNQVHEANRQIAAAIGLVRLATLAGDAARREQGLCVLSRWLAHRYALAKYPRWRHEIGTLEAGRPYPPAYEAGGVAISERNVLLGFGQNQEGQLPYFGDVEGPLACLVPELGRFFADHLPDEARAIAEQTSKFYPDALLAWGSPRRSAEWWHNYPQDAQRVFLNHAWILQAEPGWLYRHTDVPWMAVGDLYYIEKLAEVLFAGRVRWTSWPQE